MELKAIVKYCGLVALLSVSMSVFAAKEQIKCPSVEFVKSTYTDTLERVTRFDFMHYNIEGFLEAYDEASNLDWSIEIQATAPEYDFNSAFKKAQYSLANVIKVESEFADNYPTYATCQYYDRDGNLSIGLVAEKSSKLKHMKR